MRHLMSEQSSSSGRVGPAALAVIFASLLLGFTDNLVILLADDIGLWQFHVIRGLVVLVFLCGHAAIMRIRLLPRDWPAVLFRGFSLTVAIIMFFAGLPLTGAAVAGAGMFTAPIFVLLFSVLLFSQSIGLYRIVAVFIGSIGVVLVLNITSSNFSLFALIPVLAGAFYAVTNIATRRICADETPQALMLVYTVMITGAGAAMATIMDSVVLPSNLPDEVYYIVRGWEPISLYNSIILLINGIGAYVALLFLVWGYQQAETSYVTIYEYSYLIFAGFFGWLFWQDSLGLQSIFGIILIVFAGTLITVRTGRS